MNKVADVARHMARWSLGTAGIWLAGGALGVALTVIVFFSLADTYLKRTGVGDAGVFLFVVTGLIVLATAACVVVGLEAARRSWIASRIREAHAQARAPERLARAVVALGGLRLLSLVSAVVLMGASLPPMLQVFGWGTSRNELPDAVAISLAGVIGFYPVVLAGLAAHWMAVQALRAGQAVLSADGHYWWDGQHWQQIETPVRAPVAHQG